MTDLMFARRLLAHLNAMLLAGSAALAGGAIASLPASAAERNGTVVAQAAPERQERDGRRERDRDGKPDAEREAPKQPPQSAPKGPERPSAQQQQQERGDERRGPQRDERPAERQKPAQQQQQPPQQPPAAQQQPQRGPAAAQPQTPPQPPAAQRPASPTQQPPAAQQQTPPQRQQPPAAQRQTPPAQQPPAAQQQAPQQQQPPAAQRQAPPPQQPPAAAQQQQQQAPAALAPPTQARDAREFIRRGNDGPGRGMDQVRRERREVREGDRTVIREGGRTIIRHNESNRFAVGARDVRVERRGGTIETVIERGNGIRIVSVTDADGRLIRRVRRDASGRDVIIIDNSFAGPRTSLFVQLAVPTIRIPRERYIVEMGRARPQEIYDVFLAPPVQRVESRYTLDQVRFSAPLRAYMPRVDLDISFETGSWQITPDQIGKLEVIAQGIIRAIERNPREVILIEGHTDAVGGDEDNLSLSDRRAESVAIALTEEFQVPPENIVTQGYGEQDLKVQTDGPSRENRRVAVRRITPLIDQQVSSTGGR